MPKIPEFSVEIGNPENPEIKTHNFSGNCAAGSTMAPLCSQINASALRLLARGE